MTVLAGKVVWVTGAGSGIGRAIAIAFAREGAQVALTGRGHAPLEETASMVQEAGGTVMIAPADLAVAEDITGAHATIAGGLGDPDILVNNAGTNTSRRHWHELDTEAVARVIDVNLKAIALCTLAVLPAMRRRGGGTVIHVSSLAGVSYNPVSGPIYIAAKTAVRALSNTINAEHGIHGIRSVCINPGETATAILNTRANPPSAEERAIMVQPEDIAAAAIFATLLPTRTCIAEMTIVPTDNSFERASARRIASAYERG
ncbi:MAG TPA: SDR family oxidoreductase [Acetobacteraceae bacterium]|nr:SDR family oxidoreductase [Acetobacteraceae bacterium]